MDSMCIAEAIAIFDKSADRTTPNHQTRAWQVIRARLDAALATPPAAPAQQDKSRLDVLEDFVRTNGGIVLHNGSIHGDYSGLGLGNTSRTLREAIDQMAGFDVGMNPAPPAAPDEAMVDAVMSYFNCEAEGTTGTRLYVDDRDNMRAALTAALTGDKA